MTRQELGQLIADVQRRQSELDNVEVKAARGGTPRRLYEPLSAFANRIGGGVLLFGLDESKDFSIIGVGDVQQYDRPREGYAWSQWPRRGSSPAKWWSAAAPALISPPQAPPA